VRGRAGGRGQSAPEHIGKTPVYGWGLFFCSMEVHFWSNVVTGVVVFVRWTTGNAYCKSWGKPEIPQRNTTHEATRTPVDATLRRVKRGDAFAYYFPVRQAVGHLRSLCPTNSLMSRVASSSSVWNREGSNEVIDHADANGIDMQSARAS